MPPKKDVPQERKAQIYEAAFNCFHRKGYYRTTMDDIAVESELSKGTLYWYFESKKDLFVSMLRQVMEPLGQRMASIAGQEGSAVDKLRASLALFRAESAEMKTVFGIMMEAWALTRHDEQVENLIREIYAPYAALMTGIVQEGVSSGEFNVNYPEAMSLVLLALFDGITLSMGTGLWQCDENEIMDEAEWLVLHGLGVEVSSGDR
jgi:TetR/AcrR family fatty acid metabolism transcriptional regulator